MQFFCLQLEASCLQWSFFTYIVSFFPYNCLFAYSGMVCLISALRDCKQRSLTISKRSPTVSKRLPPFIIRARGNPLILGASVAYGCHRRLLSRGLSEYCFACGSRTRLTSKRITKPYSEPIQTVLTTSPNRTYLETIETVLDLYSDKGMIPFLLRGTHKRDSLKIDAFPFSNCARNRAWTTADSPWIPPK